MSTKLTNNEKVRKIVEYIPFEKILLERWIYRIRTFFKIEIRLCVQNNSWDEIKRRIDYNLTIKAKNASFVLQQKLLKTPYFV
jgi:hypothetical protein